MKIGVYGGTFNPPHMGHLNTAKRVKENLELDMVVFVPTAIPPHKHLPKGSPSPEQRVEMLKVAIDSLGMSDYAAVDDLELRREGPSYTSDTLRELKRRYPTDELYFLMGSDMLRSLPEWHEPEVVCALAKLVVFRRTEKDDYDKLYTLAEEMEKEYHARITLTNTGQIVETSSTKIRKLLGEGDYPKNLPPMVYGYILRHDLYETNRDLKDLTLDELRICSLSMVYAKRHRHILGVEETAAKLACFWGADPELARRAGILHDCTKYLSLEEHLGICEAERLELDEMEAASAKLLHSKTGAALARHLYGQNDEVYWAIYWHTTGKADMSLLEKIIYLADYMEPNRDFDGVEELRRLCYEDLDAALLLGVQMSIDDLKERGVPIHKNTQGALDWLLTHGKG